VIAVGSIYATGQVISGFSDIELKDIVGLIENPLTKLDSIRGVRFKPSDKARELGVGVDRDEHVGVIAQEVEAVMPQVIRSMTINEDTFLVVEYDRLVPLLIEAIKTLSAKVTAMEDRINDLRPN
jgi:hypothetical protein